ncbi:hypothetical protein MIR68_005522 [Amoeboaphelidium protococcarum]|nr:hypothetical protein MIR68_005522 [Amoeboaphelidium protococcarum]
MGKLLVRLFKPSFAFMSIYGVVLFDLFHSQSLLGLSSTSKTVLPFLPLILLILFGAYCALTLIYNVLTINDCPEAYQELQREIIEAKQYLSNRGVDMN